jgi:hypothetical protein
MDKKTREEVMKEQQAELDAIVKETRAAFAGAYADQLAQLQGLSDSELSALVPDVTAHAVYSQLMEVVKRASANNLGVAELKQRIQALGSSA